MQGAEATREIRAAPPDTQVLVLTTCADDHFLFPALQAGARGYLTDRCPPREPRTPGRLELRGVSKRFRTPDGSIFTALADTGGCTAR
jgi:DNA-binding NarL/FixJ family response regulator